MPVTADKPAPYAPASAVLSLVERHRNKGLPSPIDADVLGRAGISPSLIPRTLQALQMLDLLSEDQKPSPVFEGMRLAPETEYKQRMIEWLNSAYADALSFVDPAVDDETRVRDAFRSYKPVGQQSRMVSLFIGLYAAADVGPEKVTKRPPSSPRPAVATKPRPAVKPQPSQQRQQLGVDTGGDGGGAFVNHGSLPPALAGLLASLPKGNEGWTQVRRDKFMATFGAVADFCFPIVEPQAAPAAPAAGTDAAADLE